MSQFQDVVECVFHQPGSADIAAHTGEVPHMVERARWMEICGSDSTLMRPFYAVLKA